MLGGKEHSCRKMTDGVEGSDGRRFAKPAKDASLFVLSVRKENGRLWVVAVVVARHPS